MRFFDNSMCFSISTAIGCSNKYSLKWIETQGLSRLSNHVMRQIISPNLQSSQNNINQSIYATTLIYTISLILECGPYIYTTKRCICTNTAQVNLYQYIQNITQGVHPPSWCTAYVYQLLKYYANRPVTCINTCLNPCHR